MSGALGKLVLASFVFSAGGQSGDRSLACSGPWERLKRQLLVRLVAPESSDPIHIDGDGWGDEECVLGQIALQLTSLLQEGGSYSGSDIASAWSDEWRIIGMLSWPSVIRSGWPVFQLLRRLSEVVYFGSVQRGEAIDADSCWVGQPFADLLRSHLSRKPQGSVALTPSALSFVASDSNIGSCPLLVSAAFVALAWSRLPVYDLETESLLKHSERHAQAVGLPDLISAPTPLVEVLAQLEESYQIQHHFSPPSGDGARETTGACVVPMAGTASGHCNFFAPIDWGLAAWRTRGVFLDDVVRAFRPVTDQKLILFRWIDGELIQVLPQHSHLDADFGAAEPTCLARAIVAVLAKANVPSFDIVLNHGDLPILRRMAGRPPFYGPTDWEARTAAPLFSICGSVDFWDILFPNVCRPSLVNMSEMSATSWHSKKDIAFWRGTDRGAVNWATQVSDIFRGSPRKRFLNAWADAVHFDAAFLEDDLLNATVVNTDPNFVPLSQWPEWRYLLDLPGNGYSGSLKQKLTSSSAVMLVTDNGVEGSHQVYEHYHAGLQDLVHVLHIDMQSAGEVLQWAREHDEEVSRIAREANAYMDEYEQLTQCYIWSLLHQYAQLLRYTPSHDQLVAFGAGISVQTHHVDQVWRQPSHSEDTDFEAACKLLLEEHAK